MLALPTIFSKKTNYDRSTAAATRRFLEKRDFLIQNRLDYKAAYQGFQWPVFHSFNWALDVFALQNLETSP
jgi:hypothetical protein